MLLNGFRVNRRVLRVTVEMHHLLAHECNQDFLFRCTTMDSNGIHRRHFGTQQLSVWPSMQMLGKFPSHQVKRSGIMMGQREFNVSFRVTNTALHGKLLK